MLRINNTSGKLIHLIRKHRNSRTIVAVMKPPNILIKTNHDDEYSKMKDMLLKLLVSDRYTIYEIKEEGLKKEPWMNTCQLLVYNSGEGISNEAALAIKKYWKSNNGKIIIHQGGGKFVNQQIIDGIFNQENDENFVFIDGNLSQLENSHKFENILKRLGFNLRTENYSRNEEKFKIPMGYYYSKTNQKLEDVFDIDIAKRSIQFISNSENTSANSTTDDDSVSEITIQTADQHCKNFNWDIYNNALDTKVFGQAIVFTNFIPSTQTFLKNLNINTIKQNGFLVTARQQGSGIGRSGNMWLSPIGCMMFSMKMIIPIKSNLGRSLPLIQHLAVTAFINYVKKSSDYKDIKVNIKWPNDIYANGNIKIGGVMVNTSTLSDKFHVIIGMGVNICNEKPTYSFNQLIDEYMNNTGKTLKVLTVEEALAGTVTEIERLVDFVQQDGIEAFKSIYYDHWLHSNKSVTLEVYNNTEANILGIDDHGYLLAQPKGSNETLTLQPDGNTFDMMANLIKMKI